MKLSEIIQSHLIHPNGEDDGGGSWVIFMSPEDPNFVVKLFYDIQQFTNEKVGYDKVLCEPNLMQFANKYRVTTIQLDTSSCPSIRKCPPHRKALLLPFFASPPWENIGKLSTPITNSKLAARGIDVEKITNEFHRIGLAWWEATFFIHTNLHDIKAIDFTYSEVALNMYTKVQESE